MTNDTLTRTIALLEAVDAATGEEAKEHARILNSLSAQLEYCIKQRTDEDESLNPDAIMLSTPIDGRDARAIRAGAAAITALAASEAKVRALTDCAHWSDDDLIKVIACRDQRIAELEQRLEDSESAATNTAIRVTKIIEQRCPQAKKVMNGKLWPDAVNALIDALEAELAAKTAECEKAVDSIWECRVFLRGCMNHAFDETPIVEVAKDVSEEFHRNRYQIQCIAKERDNIAKERDAANLLLKRLMCVVVPDNAVPNDMKEFVRDSAATVLKDLWDYLKTDADLRKAEHDAG